MKPMTALTIAQFKSRIGLVVGMLVLAVIAVSTWSIVSERRDVIASAERQSAGYVRALAEHSESALAESDRVLRDTLHDLPLLGGSQRELHDLLRREIAGSPQMGSLFIVDATGVMFNNSDEFPPKPINVADREYFRYYLSTPGADRYLGKPVMSRLVNRWRFNMMRPLNRPGEPFRGLLAVAFEVEYFKQFFSTSSLGPRGRVALVRTDGAPLVLEPHVDKAYESNFSTSELFREQLPGSSSGTFHTSPNRTTIDGDPRIVSYQKLTRFPVIAVVSLDEDDVLASWENKAVLQSVMTLALCLAIIILTRLVFRYLNRLQTAQNSLREQQELVRLKAAQIDAANDAIMLLDMEGRLVQFNNALCQMTGHTPEELRDRRLHDIKPPAYAAQIEVTIRMLLERREATFESVYLTKGGSVLPIEVHAIVMESGGRKLILNIARNISERKRSEHRELTRLRILEELATGSSLPDLLTLIVKFVEQEQPGALCSVLLADEEGIKLRHGAAPSLPESYNQAVDGLRIAQGMGSCGTAAYSRQRVIVEEIEGHPYWKGFKPACEAGLRACWSEPVLASDGELLGTFAMYHRTPRSPDDAEIQLIESAAHLASIAIERFKTDERRNRLEEQLHHVQKIDAIGQLAGGIAHDFNNLLTPILVYADMIQHRLPDDDPLSGKARGIVSAACKARDLTKQLLSFGRKQMLNMQTLELNEVVGTFQDILRRTIRENIAIDTCLVPGSVFIRADRGQMEQILLNLAVNAQDAINGNGSIVVETGRVVLDNEYARLHPGTRPGPYAVLSFGDSGCGMDDETLRHIFEPFFTTKEVGHGTGLGLATVYGIIKQHEGYISVRSRVGGGTTFMISLPLSQEPVAEAAHDDAPALPARATLDRTILVVEDNAMMRDMAVELLEASGYRVLVADRPSKARDIVLKTDRAIDLLLTDVVMPEMSGHDLYEILIDTLPDLRVLYISGYTNEVFVRNGTLEEGINFLQKPFTTEQLLDRVRISFE